MKILQINTVVNTGSTGRIVENIGVKVIANNWSSIIAYSNARSAANSLSYLIKVGSKADFYSHVLLTRMFDRHAQGSKSSTKKLILKIEKIEPDVIHLHNIHGYYLNISVLFKYLKSKGIPIVWTMHDCWSFTGHCAYFDYIKCDKWETECNKCPNVSSYPSSWFFDSSNRNFLLKKELFNYPNIMVLVPVSKWLEENLKNSFLHLYPRKVIYNGVDLSVFKEYPTDIIRLKYGIIGDKPIILGVANMWENRKGLNDFFKIAEQVNDYLIILVGLNKKQLKSLPSGIIGISRTDNIEDLAMLYSVANVFVNPTYEDNFPTTNIEALACGTPVITYDTGGSPEAIDNKTGYIVDKGNIDELIFKIRKVCQRGKDYFKKECRMRAEKLFNKENRYNDYIELYKEILNKNNVTIQK